MQLNIYHCLRSVVNERNVEISKFNYKLIEISAFKNSMSGAPIKIILPVWKTMKLRKI